MAHKHMAHGSSRRGCFCVCLCARAAGGPRAVEVALPGAGRYGAALELRTLHLRPDEGLLELTWAARIPVFFEYPSELLAGLKADVRD